MSRVEKFSSYNYSSPNIASKPHSESPKFHSGCATDKFFSENLSKVCTIDVKEHNLKWINTELDVLDDNNVFPSSRPSEDTSQNQLPPLLDKSRFASVIKPLGLPMSTGIDYYVYLTSATGHKLEHDEVSDIKSSLEQNKKNPDSRVISPEIAQDARREATVLQRVTELRRQGLWSASRLPKVMEPQTGSFFSRYLLDEVTWMAVDFAEERCWKKHMARKLAEAACNYLMLRQEWNRQCEIAEQIIRQRNAARVAAMVKQWWRSIYEDLRRSNECANHEYTERMYGKNKLALALHSDLGPTWMAKAQSVSPIPLDATESDQSEHSLSRKLCADADLSDTDWLPHCMNDISDHSGSSSRSTSSSRAASFICEDDELLPSRCSRPIGSQHFLIEKMDESTTYDSTGNSLSTDDKPSECGSDLWDEIPADEVEALMADAHAPLDLYAHAKSCLPTSNRQVKLESSHSSSISMEVLLLKEDASLPVEELLPPEFIPYRSLSATERLTSDRLSPSQDDAINTDSDQNSSDTLSFHSDTEELAKSEYRSIDKNIILPPWSLCDEDNNLCSIDPSELRWIASRLSPLLKPIESDDRTDQRFAQLITARLPTFRLHTLPSFIVAGISAWLRQAFLQKIPALLLSGHPISGDAELAIAAHLGQLVVPFNTNEHEFPSSSKTTQNVGVWGPHLIITSRLHLSTWKNRLAAWCPGFRVICLGLISSHKAEDREPCGTGARLRSAIARGAVNICLTTYAAVLARPNRYSTICWNVIVFDEVHHLLPCSDLSPPTFQQSSSNSTGLEISDRVAYSLSASNAIDTLLSELKFSGHRLLISSSPDLVSSACGYRLFELARLLLSTHTSGDKTWAAKLFDSVSQTNQSGTVCQARRDHPTKHQLTKFLEPFLLRFDDDYEVESAIDRVVYCPLTHSQRIVHDAAMTSKTAQNALKTGNLLDVLQTVSLASRICSHSSLIDAHTSTSSKFLQVLDDLSCTTSCAGPFAFNTVSRAAGWSFGLTYHTPKMVLRAVKTLRDSDLSELTLQGFQLMHFLTNPAYIRSRVASLIPKRKLLRNIINPVNEPERSAPPPLPRPTFNLGLTNGNYPASTTSINRSVDVALNGDLSDGEGGISGLNLPITNGLPEGLHLDFSSIPVRQKRPRMTTGFTPPSRPPQDKRPRLDVHDSTTTRSVCNVLHPTAFIGPDVVRILQSEGKSAPNSDFNQIPVSSKRFDSPSKPAQFVSPPVQSADRQFVGFNPSLHEIFLVRDNERRCRHLIGHADWCSELTCNRFVVSPIRNLSDLFPGVLATLSNIGTTVLTTNLIDNVICARPLVISKISKCDTSTRVADQHYLEQQRFTQFERVRWFNVRLPPHALYNPVASCRCECSGYSAIGRLFSASGKLSKLNDLLVELIGPQNSKRVRCIYFLAHRNAFLDIIEAFLTNSSWRSIPLLRIHGNYEAVGPEAERTIQFVNNWPRGSKGPLFLLLNSRGPLSHVAGLRASPDTAVIVCDFDWRAASVDNLRVLFHSWFLNGLVDSVQSNKFLPPFPLIYRLISHGAPDQHPSFSSVEACLARGVACRLLPEAVFLANSAEPNDRIALTIARVQPNVVGDMLSEPMSFASAPKGILPDRDTMWSIKQEAPSYSSSSSITSSHSNHYDGSRRDPGDDECFTFQERIPLIESQLNRAFELFEDPVDCQNWCCEQAEQLLVAQTILDDSHCPISLFESMELDDQLSVDDGCDDGNLTSSTFLLDDPNVDRHDPFPQDLQNALNYTDNVGWEVAHNETCSRLVQLESIYDDLDTGLTYIHHSSTTGQPHLDMDEAYGLPTFVSLDNLPIWEPFLTHEIQNVPLHHDDTLRNQTEENSTRSIFPYISDYLPNWGYESEPMSEHELPPVTHIPATSATNASDNSSVSATISSTVGSLKRAHFNSPNKLNRLSRAGNNLSTSSGGSHVKRRKLNNFSTSSLSTTTKENSSSVAHSSGGILDSSLQDCGDDLQTTASKVLDHEKPQKSSAQGPICHLPGSTSTALGQASSMHFSTNTVVLSRSQFLAGNVTGPKLHTPRICYTKEAANPRTNRLRRTATITPVSSATVLAAGSQLVPPLSPRSSSFPSSHHLSVGAGGALPNPAVLARYGQLSAGTQVQGRAGSVSVNQLYSPGTYQMGTGSGSAPTGHLHVGKPLEWSTYEEAALYQSIFNLQDIPFETNGSTYSNFTPNFRLAEFFLNNFFPTRGYRGARQCLLMHAKMQSITHCALSSLSPNATSFLHAHGYMPPEQMSINTPASSMVANTRGPTGRKVKNKMKSAAATAAANLGASGQPGSLGSMSQSLDGNADTTAAVNRFRAYLTYQHLQNVCDTENIPPALRHTATSTGADPIPSNLQQFLTIMRVNDDNQARYLRKAIETSLFSPQIVHPQIRAPTSRRTNQGGYSAAQSSASIYHSAISSQSNVSSTATSGVFSHSTHLTYSSSTSPFSVPTSSHPAHPCSIPALLTHRHHRHAANDHTIGSQGGGVSSDSPGSGLLPNSSATFIGPIIQKNPTHIAALQEHNINPDTLITPAMVIKHKEEREARLSAEMSYSISSSPFTLCSSSSSMSTGTILTASHSAQDATLHPSSAVLSVPMESSTIESSIGVTASSLNPVTGQLSYSHTGQRGASFVTIVSSNPNMLRRSNTFTSVNLNTPSFADSSLSSRLSTIQPIQPQSSITGLGGSNLSGQVSKTGGYFLQRPQLAGSSASLSRGSNYTNLTGVTPLSGLSIGSGYGSSITSLPQILRPRGTFRGSVIQPTFVRTLSANNASVFPISQVGVRHSSTGGSLLHNRITLAVSSPSPTISNVLVPRTSMANLRSQPPAVFHQVRPVISLSTINQGGLFTYGGSLPITDTRSFLTTVHNPSSNHQTVGSNINTVSSSAVFESASSRQSEADPFVQSRFHPQPQS